ncbi:MAG: hypothetical protein FWF37_02190 [Chloroflexi bacterium]|nr:hypothetical protein [Chloroflexota bacterium]
MEIKKKRGGMRNMTGWVWGIIVLSIAGLWIFTAWDTNKPYIPVGYDYCPIEATSKLRWGTSEPYALYMDITVTNNSTKTVKEIYTFGKLYIVVINEEGEHLVPYIRYMNILLQGQTIKGKETKTFSCHFDTSGIVLPYYKFEATLQIYYIKFSGFGGEWGYGRYFDIADLEDAPYFPVEPVAKRFVEKSEAFIFNIIISTKEELREIKL